MLTFLRGFRDFRGPNGVRTAGFDPPQDTTDGKIPKINVQVSQAPYFRPSNRWTQADQDHFDEEARQQARESLIQSWKDRLSGISLITTFFVATEAQLLGGALSSDGNPSRLGNAASAGLIGALLIHSFAAIASFIAAFFLISHTIHEAKLELMLQFDDEVDVERTESIHGADFHQHRHIRETSVTKRGAQLVHVCRFNNTLPPVQLLERCNQLCMFLTATGFTLEVMGILCYAWDKMGVVVSAFASGLTLFCLFTSAIVLRPTSR